MAKKIKRRVSRRRPCKRRTRSKSKKKTKRRPLKRKTRAKHTVKVTKATKRRSKPGKISRQTASALKCLSQAKPSKSQVNATLKQLRTMNQLLNEASATGERQVPASVAMQAAVAPTLKYVQDPIRARVKKRKRSISKNTGRKLEPYLQWKPSWQLKKEKEAQIRLERGPVIDPIFQAIKPKKSKTPKKSKGRQPKKTKGRPTAIAKAVKGMTCPICQDLLVGSMTLGCGHNFCQECLVRMLVYKTADLMKVGKVNCPMCSKSIAQHPCINIQLDETIRMLVKLSKNSQVKAMYKERVDELDEFRREEMPGLNAKIVHYCNTFINEAYNNPAKAWPYVTRHLPWFSWMHTAVLDLQR